MKLGTVEQFGGQNMKMESWQKHLMVEMAAMLLFAINE